MTWLVWGAGAATVHKVDDPPGWDPKTALGSLLYPPLLTRTFHVVFCARSELCTPLFQFDKYSPAPVSKIESEAQMDSSVLQTQCTLYHAMLWHWLHVVSCYWTTIYVYISYVVFFVFLAWGIISTINRMNLCESVLCYDVIVISAPCVSFLNLHISQDGEGTRLTCDEKMVL